MRRSRAEAADTEALVGLLKGPGFRTQGQEAKASAPGEEPNQAGRPGQDGRGRLAHLPKGVGQRGGQTERLP